MLVFVILAIVGHLLSGARAFSWSACGEGLVFTPTNVVLNPKAVERSKPFDITISARLQIASLPVTGGILTASVMYKGFHVYSTSRDLCDTIACPVLPGTSCDMNTTTTMPWWAPKGGYQLRFEATLPADTPHDSSSTRARKLLASQLKATRSIRTDMEDVQRAASATAERAQGGKQPQALASGRHVGDSVTMMCVDVQFDVGQPSAGWNTAPAAAVAVVVLLSGAMGASSVPSPNNTLRDCLSHTSAQLAFPSSPEYTSALKLEHNTDAATARPLAFVFPNSTDQCGRIILCARESRVPIVARSGGHSYEAYSLVEGGIVLDLAHMTHVLVDSHNGTALIGAGNWLGRIYWELQAAGRWVLPSGTCGSVGIGGHALGGGYGWLSRQHGLVTDAILSVTLVDSAGSVRYVDNTTDPELFWALRGAGAGNFGVVTEFRFRIFKQPTKMAQIDYTWPYQTSDRVLAAFTGHLPLLPRDVTGQLYSQAGGTTILMTLVRAGPLEGFKQLVGAFLATFPSNATINTTEFDSFVDFEFPERHTSQFLLRRENLFYSLSFKAASVIVDGALSPAGIDAVINGPRVANCNTWFQVHGLGGAIADVPPNATAFPLRSPNMTLFQLYTSWPEQRYAAPAKAMIRQWRGNISRYATPMAYINYIDQDVSLSQYFGEEGLKRLKRVKKRVDPENLWRFAQSIPT